MARRAGDALAVAFSVVFFAFAPILTTNAWADDTRVLTGPPGSGQSRIGGELARRLSTAAGVPIGIVETAGPGELLQRLRDEIRPNGLDLAVVQADIGQLYLNAALGGNREAASWLTPLRVVAPLYREDLHFIVRSDSPFEALQDIRHARINVGPVAGGAAMSVATLYRLLFNAAPPPENLSRFGNEEALAKLLTDRSIDVVAVLGEQPVALLAAMKPEARRYIRLLQFDREHPSAPAVSRVYGASTLRVTSYPRLLDHDVPTLAVRLYLVAQGEREGLAAQRLRRIGAALCTELPRLKAGGHQKWREIPTGLPALMPGWHYSEASTPDLARCLGLAENEIPDLCPPDEQALGLCHTGIAVTPTPGDDATGDSVRHGANAR